MANLEEYKKCEITEEEKHDRLMGTLPGTKLTGTAQENKEKFDRMSLLITDKHNTLVDIVKNNDGEVGEMELSLLTRIEAVEDKVREKVDKKNGWDLSERNFSPADKEKLDGIMAGAEVNTIDSIKLNGTLFEVFDKQASARIDSTDILHVGQGGTKLISDCLDSLSNSVSGLENNMQNKVDKEDGKGLSSNDYDTSAKEFVDENKGKTLYKKGEKIVLSKENDIVLQEKNNEYLLFDKDNYYDIPTKIIGKNNFTNKKAGLESQSTCNTLISCGTIYGNNNAIMEDCINLSICGNSNTVLPRNKVDISACEFTHIGDNKYKIKDLSNNNIFATTITNKQELFVCVKDNFKSFSSVNNRITPGEVSWTSDEPNSIVIDLSSFDNSGSIQKDDVIIYKAVPYHNNITYNRGIQIDGSNNVAFLQNTHLIGETNVAFKSGTAIGRNLFIDSGGGLYIGQNNNFSTNNQQNNAFVIGWGSYNARRNVFRVDTEGGVFAQKEYASTGADYAEYFEWADGNPNDEDRTGHFVTLDGDKIKIAESGDWILGVISAKPSVIGDSYDDDWHNKYITDEFGRIIYEEVIVPAEYETINGEQVLVEEERTEMHPRINPNYSSTKEYIPRSKRKEWAAVGMMGKLFVKDDGKCHINSFCKVGNGGIAVPDENGYRVMKRVNENIIQVLVR